jgi:hypothetical protein
MAAILSSQTRDEVTHAAMLRLPAHGCTSAHLLEVLKELLKPVSFCARKAEYVQNTSTILLAQYGGDIPSTLNKELLALPGVGPNLHRSPLETAIHTCAPRHTCTSTVLCWAPQYTTEVARSEGAVELCGTSTVAVGRCLTGCVCVQYHRVHRCEHQGGHWWLCALRRCLTVVDAARTGGSGSQAHSSHVYGCVASKLLSTSLKTLLPIPGGWSACGFATTFRW